MSPASLNLTALSASAVVPSSGSNYQVVNLGFGHWLDNADGALQDGNPVLSWSQNSPETSNQIVRISLPVQPHMLILFLAVGVPHLSGQRWQHGFHPSVFVYSPERL